jgi:hypothetical protein
MADRSELHHLVDDLPDAALDATFRVLENYQKWPRKAHADPEQMLKRSQATFMRQQEKHARRTGIGLASATGSARPGPDGCGSSSTHGWEGQARITATFIHFRGYQLEMVHRVRFSDDRRKLLFSMEVKTPNGIAQRHDFLFDLAESDS